jgi:predicted metal-dependent HD superfamily phosphohydrolase
MASLAGRAWVAAVACLGGAADVAAGAAADLERRYGEPHRRYHTLAHVDAVLDDVARLADELPLSQAERAIANLAGCAHDVIYLARPGADERASAAWATEQLTACGLVDAVGNRVADIVLATITHTADDLIANVVLDADLAILAADEDRYARYVDDVRAEYSAIPESHWRAGRAGVVGRLLDRPVLYATDPARRWWDAAARRNLAAELARLTG